MARMTPRSIRTRFALHSGLMAALLCVPSSAAFAQDAIALLRNRAAHGDVEAEVELGVRYARGLGVRQDDFEAVRWLHRAAERGNTEAQFNLGIQFEKRNSPGDFVLAQMWYTLAASQGHDPAAKRRDKHARRLNAEQLSDARELARVCTAQKFRNCGR